MSTPKRLKISDLKLLSKQVRDGGVIEYTLDALGMIVQIVFQIDDRDFTSNQAEIYVTEERHLAGYFYVELECDRVREIEWDSEDKDEACPPVSHLLPALKSWVRQETLLVIAPQLPEDGLKGLKADEFEVLGSEKNRNGDTVYSISARGLPISIVFSIDPDGDTGHAEIFFTRDQACSGLIFWQIDNSKLSVDWDDPENVLTGPYRGVKGAAKRWVTNKLREEVKGGRSGGAAGGGCMLTLLAIVVAAVTLGSILTFLLV